MSAPALRLSGVCKNFGVSQIIKGVDLEIGQGERPAIIFRLRSVSCFYAGGVA